MYHPPPSENPGRGDGNISAMKVYVAGPLRSYTGGASAVEAEGTTLAAILADLDRRYPGMRFRMIDEQDSIRQHIKLFVNYDLAGDLGAAVRTGDEVHIICAISGGSVNCRPVSSRRACREACSSLCTRGLRFLPGVGASPHRRPPQ